MTNSELPHASARVESHASEESANSTEPNIVSRRRALQASTLTAAGAVASVAAQGGVAAAAPGQHKVFQHGVASGDPLPNGVLLWTRVTSRPNDYAGRGRGVKTQVKWEISLTRTSRRSLHQGLLPPPQTGT